MRYYYYTFTTTTPFEPWTFIFATDTDDNLYMKALNHAIGTRYFDEKYGITIWTVKELNIDEPLSNVPTNVQEFLKVELDNISLTNTFKAYTSYFDLHHYENNECSTVKECLEYIMNGGIANDTGK
ncbi:MAG: hypothetical protein E7253_04530 [Lachnospiraceae bacterium]|nr:hypothetical protein [Lachnospiraceae bacterium]